MKIYIDESGNLGGLGSKVSEEDPYFVLAALIAREEGAHQEMHKGCQANAS